jgi:hypothetical protein
MDFLAGRTKLKAKDITKKATVASNCWAYLMYYLFCVNTCLKDDDGEDLVPENLKDYDKYDALSEDDKLAILALCSGPLLITNLIDKILFLVDKVDGGYSGRFYKITETTELVALGIRADRVVGIGGSSKEVTTIMLMTEYWVNSYFAKPLKEAAQSLQRQTHVAPRVTYSSYQSPKPSPKPLSTRPSCNDSYFTVLDEYDEPEPEPAKSCCNRQKLSGLAGKFKPVLNHIILFFLGLVVLGYVSCEIAPVYIDQKDALDASNYNTWPLNVCFPPNILFFFFFF